MYKLGRRDLVFSIFITSTKLKTLKLVLTYTKNVREFCNANFKKSVKRFSFSQGSR